MSRLALSQRGPRATLCPTRWASHIRSLGEMARAYDAGCRVSGVRRAQSVDVGDEIRVSDEPAASESYRSEGTFREKALHLPATDRQASSDLVQVVELWSSACDSVFGHGVRKHPPSAVPTQLCATDLLITSAHHVEAFRDNGYYHGG
jgi:hypothetical protein